MTKVCPRMLLLATIWLLGLQQCTGNRTVNATEAFPRQHNSVEIDNTNCNCELLKTLLGRAVGLWLGECPTTISIAKSFLSHLKGYNLTITCLQEKGDGVLFGQEHSCNDCNFLQCILPWTLTCMLIAVIAYLFLGKQIHLGIRKSTHLNIDGSRSPDQYEKVPISTLNNNVEAGTSQGSQLQGNGVKSDSNGGPDNYSNHTWNTESNYDTGGSTTVEESKSRENRDDKCSLSSDDESDYDTAGSTWSDDDSTPMSHQPIIMSDFHHKSIQETSGKGNPKTSGIISTGRPKSHDESDYDAADSTSSDDDDNDDKPSGSSPMSHQPISIPDFHRKSIQETSGKDNPITSGIISAGRSMDESEYDTADSTSSDDDDNDDKPSCSLPMSHLLSIPDFHRKSIQETFSKGSLNTSGNISLGRLQQSRRSNSYPDVWLSDNDTSGKGSLNTSGNQSAGRPEIPRLISSGVLLDVPGSAEEYSRMGSLGTAGYDDGPARRAHQHFINRLRQRWLSRPNSSVEKDTQHIEIKMEGKLTAKSPRNSQEPQSKLISDRSKHKMILQRLITARRDDRATANLAGSTLVRRSGHGALGGEKSFISQNFQSIFALPRVNLPIFGDNIIRFDVIKCVVTSSEPPAGKKSLEIKKYLSGIWSTISLERELTKESPGSSQEAQSNLIGDSSKHGTRSSDEPLQRPVSTWLTELKLPSLVDNKLGTDAKSNISLDVLDDELEKSALLALLNDPNKLKPLAIDLIKLALYNNKVLLSRLKRKHYPSKINSQETETLWCVVLYNDKQFKYPINDTASISMTQDQNNELQSILEYVHLILSYVELETNADIADLCVYYTELITDLMCSEVAFLLSVMEKFNGSDDDDPMYTSKYIFKYIERKYVEVARACKRAMLGNGHSECVKLGDS